MHDWTAFIQHFSGTFHWPHKELYNMCQHSPIRHIHTLMAGVSISASLLYWSYTDTHSHILKAQTSKAIWGSVSNPNTFPHALCVLINLSRNSVSYLRWLCLDLTDSQSTQTSAVIVFELSARTTCLLHKVEWCRVFYWRSHNFTIKIYIFCFF